MHRLVGLTLGLLALSCGSPPAPPLNGGPEPTAAAAPPNAPASAAASTSAAASAPPTAPKPRAPFPPPAFKPPVDRTKVEGDGAWRPVATGDEPPILVRTTVHPHPIKPHVYVAVVAIDLARVRLELVAGTSEPIALSVPPEKRPGLVAEADKAGLIAVFNGGFLTKHGQLGMKVGDVQFLSPQGDACTVALFRDPARPVAIGTWPALAKEEPSMRAYRQTPPCLIEGGAIHPEIDSEKRPRKWSGAENGDMDVRRSALGLDPTGSILFFGLGEWTTPRNLADAMLAAGARDVAQLDINWSYTRFLFYGRPPPEKRLRVTETLIPKLKHSEFGYVEKASERDFFYLVRR